MNDNPVPQAVGSPLTRAALFLVVTINPGVDPLNRVRSLFADLSSLLRAVGFRSSGANFSCILGIGSQAWDRLFGSPRPSRLHPFREIRSAGRHAVSTPGDLLFHIRADRFDLCFELGSHIVSRLGDAISVVDEVHGFRYFDARDLLGFVDGTENPTGREVVEATLIGEEDNEFAGSSYVIVQKYLHDMAGWNSLTTEQQERIIGRAKLSDIELDESVKPSNAHNALTIIEKEGKQVQILRDNMPFGRAGGEFGTYFIGYSRTPETIEEMLQNMFVGKPPGNYDRLLDFSQAVTGSLFFVPTATFLDEVSTDGPPSPVILDSEKAARPSSKTTSSDGSLNIGSLKGKDQHE
jgi:putative iron-dependent peroxidase